METHAERYTQFAEKAWYSTFRNLFTVNIILTNVPTPGSWLNKVNNYHPTACFIAKSEEEKKSQWKAFLQILPPTGSERPLVASTSTVILFNTFYDASLPNCFPILTLSHHISKIWLGSTNLKVWFQFSSVGSSAIFLAVCVSKGFDQIVVGDVMAVSTSDVGGMGRRW